MKFYSQTIKTITDCGVINRGETDKTQLEYDLLETLDELAELCKKMFFNSLSFMSQKFTSSIAKPPLDLSCNQTLKSSLVLLKEILSVQDGSILTAEDKKVDFNKVLNLILGKIRNFSGLKYSFRPIAAKLPTIGLSSKYDGHVGLHDQLPTIDQ